LKFEQHYITDTNVNPPTKKDYLLEDNTTYNQLRPDVKISSATDADPTEFCSYLSCLTFNCMLWKKFWNPIIWKSDKLPPTWSYYLLRFIVYCVRIWFICGIQWNFCIRISKNFHFRNFSILVKYLLPFLRKYYYVNITHFLIVSPQVILSSKKITSTLIWFQNRYPCIFRLLGILSMLSLNLVSYLFFQDPHKYQVESQEHGIWHWLDTNRLINEHNQPYWKKLFGMFEVMQYCTFGI